jgi:hypothetical protein
MKPIEVNRAELLTVLESVAPALSPKDVILQSSCFAFSNGWARAFDAEIYARCRSPLPKDFEAAVHGRPLLDALRAVHDNEVEVSATDKQLILSGRHDTIKVRLDPKVQLPFDKVEKPGEWYEVSADLGESLKLAAEATGKDDQKFLTTVVSLTAGSAQASDNFQVARYKTETGLEKPTLIRGSSARFLGTKTPTEVSDTKGWLHFKCGSGLIVSCQRYENPYWDLSKFYKLKGSSVTMPKRLIAALKLADVFSAEYTATNHVTVDLSPDQIQITGEGITGEASHRAKAKYDGPAAKFTIAPTILSKMVERHAEMDVCTFTSGDRERIALVIRSGPFFYLATTGTPIEANGHTKEENHG